jgi:hypothetical protein
MNIYIPANCARLCTLRPDAIGQKNAFIVAALYQPNNNIEAVRRRAERVLGRPIAKATFRRHAEHLRPNTLVRGAPFTVEDQEPYEGTKETLLAEMKAAAQLEPNHHWEHAITAVAAATDWWTTYNSELAELAELDAAIYGAETLLART